MDDVTEKTVQDLAEWLEDNSIPLDICDAFKDNEIDGTSFTDLTEKDIREIVKPLGIVKRIMRLKKQVEQNAVEMPQAMQQKSPMSLNLSPRGPLSPQSPAETGDTLSLVSSRLRSPTPLPSEDGSCRNSCITVKVETGIPLNFKISSAWRTEIMGCIKAKQLTPKVRNALVRDLVVHMYSYEKPGSRPSKKFCEHAASRLILKYPFMRDACGTGYGSWLQKITNKIYNTEKGKKKKIDDSDETEGPSTPKKRKSTTSTRYPPLDGCSISDEATYKRHFDALEKELQKLKRNKESILQLMHLTFIPRRQFIVDEACSAADILEKFPALHQADGILQEMELITQKEEGSLLHFFQQAWQEKWVPALNTYAQKHSKKTADAVAKTADVDTDDILQVRAVHALSALFTLLSKKEKAVDPEIYLIEDYPVSKTVDVAVKEMPARNSPRIGRFLVEDGIPVYYVFIEQQVLCQCSTFCKTLLIWFSTHYVFNLQYHKYYREAALFIQEFVLEMPEKGKKSSNYLSVATEVCKLATTD